MLKLAARRLAIYLAISASFAQVAFATEVLVVNSKSEPESVTIAPGGILFASSASSPFVYRVRSGSNVAEKFVDASTEGPGTFFFGVLADAATNTLWTCQLTPVTGITPVRPRSALRGFDLVTGAQKVRWNLPGVNSVCNDFSIGPDKALYITDTINGRIYKLAAGATIAELFLEDSTLLIGVDGITFLEGRLYVTNVFTSKLYRIPMDSSGKAGPALELTTDQTIKAPDGMRAAHGKLLLADSGNGKIEALTVTGDKAHITVLKGDLNTPTAVEPSGDVLWIAERGAGKALSISLPNH